MYNVNGIRVKTGCFASEQRSCRWLKQFSHTLLRQTAPAGTAISALMEPLHSQRVRV